MCILPPRDAPTTVFVAEDVDRAWDELGPYLMHDVLSYAEWNEGNDRTASLSFVSSAEELAPRSAATASSAWTRRSNTCGRVHRSDCTR